jgi:ribosomal protein S18 acetylase RimI-like enzyme
MTEVRPYRPDDEESVVALWAACDLLRPWNDPRRDIRRKLTVQPDLFLVAIDGAELVGSVLAGYDGHRGWVNYLAVAPPHRRRGLGRRLLREAEAGLLAYGCPKLNLQVRAGNATAVAFYEALGFRVDDVVSLGKRLIPDDAADPARRDANPEPDRPERGLRFPHE